MHNATLSFLIYLLYFKISQRQKRCIFTHVYDFFNSASALELNPEMLILTYGTSYIYIYISLWFLI